MTWEHGRQLSSLQTADNSVSYKYDSNGMRTQKDVDETKTYYYYDNDKNLIGLTKGNYTLLFYYDLDGNVTSFKYNGTMYYYIKNLQGDVVKIINQSGTECLSYVYDAWGNTKSASGNPILRELNPFRYRSYVYDEETGLYYLQSRYYDPFTGRFLNADIYCDTQTGSPLSTNMFAYCENNPVNNSDSTGTFWIRAISAAAGAVIFGTVAYLVASLFKLPNDLKWGAVAIFSTIGGVLGGLFGPSLISKALPKLTKWLKEVKRNTKIIKPKGENLGGIVIMNKVRIMLHLPHIKNPRNPHKYLHLQIEVFSFKWRIRLGRNVK